VKTSGLTTVTVECPQGRTAARLTDDPRWQLVQRVVSSRNFAKSSFLSSFLLYICDRELRGKPEEITEYQIGIQAFGRPATYNPGEDNVVRNYARLLRKRLDEYFETQGKDEAIRVTIPRGRYIPVFSANEASETASDTSESWLLPPATTNDDPAGNNYEIASSATKSSWAERLSVKWSLVAVAILAVSFGYICGRVFTPHLPSAPSNQLFSRIFSKDRETLVVPADSGFGIMQNLTGRTVGLGDYANGTYLSNIGPISGIDRRNLNDLGTQRYTSVVDLNIAVSLSHRTEVVPDRFGIRYARDLRMEDLKHSNAIFLGSLHSNPWVELFQKDLNFVLEYRPGVDDSVVLNRHPLKGESEIYKNAWDDNSRLTYAVLALVPSLDGRGYVVLLEGLNMAGTQAAADFLLNDQAMNPILKKARRTDGTLMPFELLLETTSIAANSPEVRTIAERYGSSNQQSSVERADTN
jgi:hypothetical protein